MLTDHSKAPGPIFGKRVEEDAGKLNWLQIQRYDISSKTSQASSFLKLSDLYRSEHPQWSQSTKGQKRTARLDDQLAHEAINVGESAMLHLDTERL